MTRADSHTHIFPPEQVSAREALCGRDPTFAELYRDPKAKLATTDRLLSALDEAGIDRAVCAGFAFAAERDIEAQNDYLLEAASTAKGRIIALATVNPANPGWARAAEAALLAGARGFGELRPANQGWDPLGEAGQTLAEMALAHHAVLQWHVSEPVGHSYPGKRGGIEPAQLCELAARHAGLRMIGAHLGGGLPFFAQMPEVKETLASVYFDTAAASLLYDDECVPRLVDLVGAEQVLFGSDYPLLSPRRQLERVNVLLRDDVARIVCGGNIDILFG
ncbi:MAG TPA: amidohydrolase family protein [Tepidiformaceae bacterium]